MSVEVGWRANLGANVDETKIFLVDGQNAKYCMYLTVFRI